MSSKKQTLEQGAFILVFAAILSKIISALFKIPIAADYCLGDLGFGYFSVYHDIIHPFVMLSASGLPVVVSKLICERKSGTDNYEVTIFLKSRKVFISLGFTVFLAFIAIIIPFLSITDTSGNAIYGNLSILPSILFCFAASAYRGYFEGVYNMTPPAISNLYESLSKLFIGFTLSFIVVRLTGNVILGAVIALSSITLGTLISLIYLHISFKRSVGEVVRTENNEKIAKTIFKTVFPIAIASLSLSLVSLIDGLTVRVLLDNLLKLNPKLLIDEFKSLTTENNSIVLSENLSTVLYGIKSKAYTLYSLVPTLVVFLGVGAVPHLTESYSKGEWALFNKNLNKVFKLTSFICIPSGVGFMVLNRRIMELVFGNSSSAVIGGRILGIYGVALIFTGLSLVLSNIMQSIDRANTAVINVIIGVIIKLILNIILCSSVKFNIYGSAVSTVICFGFIFVSNLIFVSCQKNFKIYYFKTFIKTIICSAVCGGCAYLISRFFVGKLSTLVAIAAAVIVYFVFSLLLKVFEQEEIESFPLGKKLISAFKIG